MKTRQLRLLIIFLILFIYWVWPYLFPKVKSKPVSQTPISQNTAQVSTTQTPVSQNVAGVSTIGKCQARQVNPDDSQAFLPDPGCTPGVIDPTVTQDNLTVTICHSGYTQTVRPPESYTNTLKRQQIADYGYTDTNLKDYEEDHFISLELGGSPKDPQNLWPEPHASINEKDKVENYLHTQVCSGNISLSEAQKEISQNWYEVYKRIE